MGAAAAGVLWAAIGGCGTSYRDDFYAIRRFVLQPEPGEAIELAIQDFEGWHDRFSPDYGRGEALARAGRE
ncbi:MAG: hypothetical protein KF866_12365 [Phycisphaeraceae bacterium]|nr:hypothetical protein [Phycisphaeraceae bacterium]MCW5755328.1 hypothetical protein [Phycisphaeraceae bacterium]